MSIVSRIAGSALWPMLWKEFVQMRRDRFTLGMMIGIPAIQLLLFGFAIRTEVRHLPTLVLDESRTAESRALVSAMANTRNFDIVGHVTSRDELRRRMENGSIRAALVIPPDYEANLKRHRPATAQMIVDAADPLGSAAAIAGASLAAASRNTVLAREAGVRAMPLDMRVRPWYNPAMESAIYIVPGVIGILLTLTMMVITSMAIVRERERGTLEQLVVTPVTKLGLQLGKILPFMLVGYVQMTVVILLGRTVFHVPIRGSLPLLYALTFFFILASLAIGMLVSTIVKTQVQAMQLSFLFVLPNILLSGFMFPREAMPVAAQWIGAAFPITYFLRILRGILLKGVGIEAVWRDAAVLFGFAALLLLFSTRRFRKTVE
jgi:ABC-2 type transport system permease protein